MLFRSGPEEDISPASPGSQAAEIEKSYPLGTQAPRIQDMGARMLKSRDLIILSSSIRDLLRRHRLQLDANLLWGPQNPSAATGCNSMPTFCPQNPANLPKSVLPPAQESQIAYLGMLADPDEPKRYQGLAADTRGNQRPSKCNSNLTKY